MRLSKLVSMLKEVLDSNGDRDVDFITHYTEWADGTYYDVEIEKNDVDIIITGTKEDPQLTILLID